MKNLYKYLTAVLVTLVTCFSASAFTVVVDHPEAFSKVMDGDGNAYQLKVGDNEFDPTIGSGMLVFYPQSPWEVVSFTGANYNPIMKAYVIEYNSSTTGTYTVTTRNPEDIPEPTFITLNVDHPEALHVTVMYEDEDQTMLDLTLQEGENKVETINAGLMLVSAATGWTIESAEGFMQMENTYGLNFEEGATDTYTITTKEDTEVTFITLTVDNPEALVVEVMDTEIKTISLKAGDNKIDTTNAGTLYVKAVSPWIIASAEGLTKNEETGVYSVDFVAGATDTYSITTEQEEVAPYITVNVDNLEAVTVTVQYTGGESQTVEPVNGVYKIDTTNAGTLTVERVYPWTIEDAGGLTAHWKYLGRYYVNFAAGATDTYNITTRNTLAGATCITLNVDNPQALNVRVTYNSGVEKTIELQAGDNEIPTAEGGTMEVSTTGEWVIKSAPGFQQIRDNYYLYFEAGEQGAYTISTSETSVESIFGDEVIETAVFNLQGIKVADTTENLPAGLYIVAGKKVLVK